MKLNQNRGFTVIELLVVIAIVGILIAILLPAIQSARASMRRVSCSNNLRQLTLGLHNYHDVHRFFPPGCFRNGPAEPLASGWGWASMILPQIEQGPLHNQIDFGQPNGFGENTQLLRNQIPIFTCPSDPAETILQIGQLQIASGNYVGSSGVRGLGLPGIFYENSRVKMGEILDGTSQTFLLGERINQDSPVRITSGWYGVLTSPAGYHVNSISQLDVVALVPINYSTEIPTCFSSYHAGGAQFSYCDGSVRFVNEEIDPFVFQAMGSRAGQDNVGN